MAMSISHVVKTKDSLQFAYSLAILNKKGIIIQIQKHYFKNLYLLMPNQTEIYHRIHQLIKHSNIKLFNIIHSVR